MNPPEIRALAQTEIPAAAKIVGRGMRDNPIFIQVYKGDPGRREAALIRKFGVVLEQYRKKGVVFGAFDGNTLVGVCALLEQGRCQATFFEKLCVLPALLAGAGLRAIPRVARWQSGWNRHDPKTAHWHLGPIAVDRPFQGKGIGSALLKTCCEKMDAEGAAVYLEAEKEENVRLYQRFGFEVIAQDVTLGVPGWFMQRAAQSDAE